MRKVRSLMHLVISRNRRSSSYYSSAMLFSSAASPKPLLHPMRMMIRMRTLQSSSVVVVPSWDRFNRKNSITTLSSSAVSLLGNSSWWRQGNWYSEYSSLFLAATTCTWLGLAVGILGIGASTGTDAPVTLCDANDSRSLGDASTTGTAATPLTPSQVAREDLQAIVDSHSIDDLPVYTADEVAINDGTEGRPIWMSYGGVVYDVTDFISNHPGGADKILQAAGTAIEPFWYTYRQHFASDLPVRLMEHMAIGRLLERDQDEIDAQMVELEKIDPYAREPTRDSQLLVHSDTPMNAEVPAQLLTQSYLTPNDLFYIRHHHPVPHLTTAQWQKYRLTVDLSALYDKDDTKQSVHRFTVDELQHNFPRTEVTATLQCSGNRRSGYNTLARTSGTPWGQGAVSTATFAGVLLRDLMKGCGLDDPIAAQEQGGMEHVRFLSLDGMTASIDIEKALNPYGDVLVAYEMNGSPLPRDHGYPLRIIVPGYAAVRNVKWVERIQLAATEAEGPWQRGLNYKTLPPSVTDANTVNLSQMPSLNEVSLFSGITHIEQAIAPVNDINDNHQGENSTNMATEVPTTATIGMPAPVLTTKPGGEVILVRVQGWAWAGGGRNIVRVDVTGDDGTTWATAQLHEGSNQRFHRAWAWVFWECTLPVTVQGDGMVHIASKAVDLAFNVQPESSDHTWNVRGLGNNSWYRAHAKVVD